MRDENNTDVTKSTSEKNTNAFVLINGRLVANPALQGNSGNTKTTTTRLVIANTLEKANTAADLTQKELRPEVIEGVTKIQDPTYLKALGPTVNASQVSTGLMTFFQNFNIPITLLNRVADLKEYALNFLIDDSGSMTNDSAMLRSEASTFMQNVGYKGKRFLSRWEEAEDRLHTMFNLLQFVPTRIITLRFLNSSHVITLNHRGMSPDEFADYAHQTIRNEFSRRPDGGTPIISNIKKMLGSTSGKNLNYLLTDGEPNQYRNDRGYNYEGGEEAAVRQEINDIKTVLINRSYPNENPFTFMCVSNNPEDTVWMHEIEEIGCRPGAPGYIAALRNYMEERKEVLNDQGPGFPYNAGIWRLCGLLAALYPNDLDALDQHAPLTKSTLDNLLGYETTQEDYFFYFESHPNAVWLFKEDYQAFLTTPIAMNIPAVRRFETLLGKQLGSDIGRGNDSTEPLAIHATERTVLNEFNRARPRALLSVRQNFWQQYASLEKQQAANAEKDLWSTYVAKNARREWAQFACPDTAYSQDVMIPMASAQPVAYGSTSTIVPPPQYPTYGQNNNPVQGYAIGYSQSGYSSLFNQPLVPNTTDDSVKQDCCCVAM